MGQYDFRVPQKVAFVVFKAKICGEEEVKLSKEHSEFVWATKEEIIKLKLENYLRAYLERGK